MTLAECISTAYLKATGKPTAPTVGSRKYNQLLALSEYYTHIWENEPSVDWSSLFDYVTLSSTVSATDSFSLNDEIRKVSQQYGDTIIINLNDTEWEYELVPADRLREFKYEKVVAVTGRTLRFPKAFELTDPQIGGDIIVPSYGYVEVAEAVADDIAIDDPNWLALMMAAEFVRNDITRQNQYGNIIAEANVLMERMKEDTGRPLDSIVKKWSPLGESW